MSKIKLGICQNCKEEYDNPTENKLYFAFGNWLCGTCANEWENEKRETIAIYGEVEQNG